MRLFLNTTENALLYRQDDEPLVTMYGSAAGIGVQFNDDLGTRVRAFGTSTLGVKCLSINQDGVGYRDFYVPIGTPITLEGTKVTPRKYQHSFPPNATRLYQHHFYFKTAKQANAALRALLDINIIAMYVRRSGHCRLLTFQTPYPLGPIMRGVLSHELQPVTAFFNRQPRTWEPYPMWQRITRGQVILTIIVFILFCGLQFLRMPNFNDFTAAFDFWANVVMGFIWTIVIARFSPDILGLVKSSRTLGLSRLSQRGQVQQ
jgi:hypothetical protein